MLPPFDGFPQDMLDFYSELAENNNKQWFDENKPRFKRNVQAPAQHFVESFGERLTTLVDGLRYDTRLNGAGSIFRIYRDVRFSKDKTPYKTNLAMVWWLGDGKKTERPSFYCGMSPFPEDNFFGGGCYRFTSDHMHTYREAVVDDETGEELVEIVEDLKGKGIQVNGLHYKRTPRGFDKDHPREELLRHNGLYMSGANLTPALITSPELIDVCFDFAQQISPVVKWLSNVLD